MANHPPLQRRRPPLFAFLLIAATVLAYQPVWQGGFIWDDDQHLTANPCIVGPVGFPGIWTSSAAIYYPLVLTSFWVQHALWGLQPGPYHVVNILMHAGGGVLLWRVLLALRVPGAWLGAGLWSLHPVQVSSVAWITELKNTQSGVFYLLAILCFLRWLPRRAEPGAWKDYAMMLGCAVAAILSKSSTVMLPVVLALCWWWREEEGSWRWGNLAWLVPLFLLSAAASGWTIWEEKFVSGAVGAHWAQSGPERCVIAGKALWFYLGKLLWPHPLILIYPRWHVEGWQLSACFPALAAVAFTLGLWWCACRRGAAWGRGAFFAWGYFAASLFPVLGFFDVAYFAHAFVADHFQYLASMGPLALAGSGLALAWERWSGRKLVVAVGGTLLLGLAVVTWRQSAPFADAQTLYERTLGKNPDSWMARNNLGNLVLQKGEVTRALAEFRAALALKEDYAEAHNNLGNALLQTGRLDEGMAHLRRALEIRRGYPDAENNLGNALVQTGALDEAITHYEEALRGNPDDALAHGGLGVALAQQGRLEEARGHLERAVALRPGFPDAHFNLANLCFQVGRLPEAVLHLRKVVEIRPGFLPALNRLAWVRATCSDPTLRDGPEALALALETARLSAGSDPVVLDTLAAAYAECGRFAEAVEAARRALGLTDDPELAEALRARLELYEAHAAFHEAAPEGRPGRL